MAKLIGNAPNQVPTNADLGSMAFEDKKNYATTSSPIYQPFRNIIINGDMRIDQRNAGASVTLNAGVGIFPVDRFDSRNNSSTASYTLQRVTDAPAGFVNSVKMTVTAADSLSSATQYCRIRQGVEANNVDNLGWGGAIAKAITVSFWVKSSVTGTFSMSILNSAYNYSYPVSYTISAADTWEYKTITIPGPTAGTWATGTNAGFYIEWTWGANSNILGTSGSWSANRYEGVTGQVNLMATNGATWYITGVQLEAGTTASDFEFLPYDVNLQRCQRYYYKQQATTTGTRFNTGYVVFGTAANLLTNFPVQLRTAPTALEQSGTAGDYSVITGTTITLCSSVPSFNLAEVYAAQTTFTVASGLTTSQSIMGRAANSSAYLAWSAEL